MKFEVPEEFSAWLRVGTCSWKFDSWKGLLYQEGKDYRPNDYLADYAKKLRSVEVDQWFWSLYPGNIRLPDLRTVKLYAQNVPDDFIFTVKAPNSLTLTHFYSKQPAAYAALAGKPNRFFLDNDLLLRFLERLEPLGNKLGPIMFQFEYLNKAKMPSREIFIDRFAEFISRAPREYSYALEIRNPNYLFPPFFQFLNDQNLGFVYLEGYYMPPIQKVLETYRPRTADFAVIRLHGGDRLEMEEATGEVWNRVISPKPAGLEAAAEIVRHNVRNHVRTFVNINNHYEGSAPLTIQRFLEVL